MPLIAVLIKY